MSAHTPETWEAVGCEVRTAVTAEDRRGWGVATTLHGTEASKRHEHARLIAAAPELLEVANDALAFMAAWAATYQQQHGLPDLHPEHAARIARAQAAIAKAEGKP